MTGVPRRKTLADALPAQAESARSTRLAATRRQRGGLAIAEELAAAYVPEWRFVGDPGEPTLGANWAAVAGAVWRPRFFKDPFGTVHVNGGVSALVAGPANPIFTLPAGYRPTVVGIEWVGGTLDPIYVGVGNTGAVTAVAPAVGAIPAGRIVKLGSISFYAEA